MTEKFYHFAPLLLVVVAFLLQYKIFTTPLQLEKKHREILLEVEARFATISTVNDLKAQLCEMKEKIDKIYDFIVKTYV